MAALGLGEMASEIIGRSAISSSISHLCCFFFSGSMTTLKSIRSDFNAFDYNVLLVTFFHCYGDCDCILCGCYRTWFGGSGRPWLLLFFKFVGTFCRVCCVFWRFIDTVLESVVSLNRQELPVPCLLAILVLLQNKCFQKKDGAFERYKSRPFWWTWSPLGCRSFGGLSLHFLCPGNRPRSRLDRRKMMTRTQRGTRLAPVSNGGALLNVTAAAFGEQTLGTWQARGYSLWRPNGRGRSGQLFDGRVVSRD